MISIPLMPVAGTWFTDCICAVLYGWRSYQLPLTGMPGRSVLWKRRSAIQNKYRLPAELLEGMTPPVGTRRGGWAERAVELWGDVRKESLGHTI